MQASGSAKTDDVKRVYLLHEGNKDMKVRANDTAVPRRHVDFFVGAS